MKQLMEACTNISNVKPRLALNSIGGSSALALTKILGPTGTLVTYGGMSKKPVTINTGSFIFQDIRLCGFWNSQWIVKHKNAGSMKRKDMLDELAGLHLNDKLNCTKKYEIFPLNDFQNAIRTTFKSQSIASNGLSMNALFDCCI